MNTSTCGLGGTEKLISALAPTICVSRPSTPRHRNCAEDERRERAKQILQKLLTHYGSPSVKWVRELRTPFEILVRTILSQNTTDVNADAAYEKLRSLLGNVTPERLAEVSEDEVAEAIRTAGMYRVRARALKRLAEYLLKDRNFFNRLKSMDVADARRELLKLPGVGNKTADILLLFYFRKPVFPVDTHIMRISKRLGLVSECAGYSEVSSFWKNVVGEDVEALIRAHLILIRFGREFCRARSPRCGKCPVRDLCGRGGR